MTLVVAAPRTVPMRIRDGTWRDADIWVPEVPGRFPVLLTRQPYGQRVGAADLGPAAASPVDRARLTWFDRRLKDRSGGAGAPVTLFDMGERTRRDFGSWPETRMLDLFLTSTDGTLQASPGTACGDTVVHDPWRPAPSLGGAAPSRLSLPEVR